DPDLLGHPASPGYGAQPRASRGIDPRRGPGLRPRYPGPAGRHPRRRAAGVHRRGVRSRSRPVRAGMCHRHSRARDRRLGRLARDCNVFIMAQAKARHADWPDRFFNIGFVVDPDGAVILKHYKLSALLPCERSVSPHDLFDWWVAKYGRTLQAFWPVADTAIGRLGIMMAMEGSYPENGRGLAMNGAEVVYRASLPGSFTQNDMFEISNRARALENNMYVVAPNIGGYHLHLESETPIDAGGGHSMIVDYRGAIVGKQPYTNASDLRRRPDQYRGAAPSPANGAGHQLDEGHSRRAGAADLRAA